MLVQYLLDHDPRGQPVPASRRVLADMARHNRMSVRSIIMHLRAGMTMRTIAYRYRWTADN